MTEDIPSLIENSEKIVSQSQSIKEKAQANFEGLDPFGKARAAKALANNISTATKIPTMLK